MTVAELLDNGGAWNESLLAELFLPFECKMIKRIRVSSLRPPDDWFWVGEKDGVFTVKSAYRRLAGDREALELGGVSDWGKEKWLWNRLGKSGVAPSEAFLPQSGVRRGIGNKSEHCYSSSSLHLFRDCAIVKRVWEEVGLGEEENEGACVREWVEIRWRSFGGREQALFMVCCWALWEHRNKVIFDGWEVDHWRVVRRALDVMEETEGGGFVVANREKTSRRAVRDMETRG
ncbi:uncharacterized protein LOC141628453 [Silene latifolia]|uniref:uncharacterized protein LOC141628453 n=1 Tax=Silene latifolia TaxID=37657 RepID=UPI003D785B7B